MTDVYLLIDVSETSRGLLRLLWSRSTILVNAFPYITGVKDHRKRMTGTFAADAFQPQRHSGAGPFADELLFLFATFIVHQGAWASCSQSRKEND